MAVTPNYGLEKPAGTDYYNIAIFNANMDTVDSTLGNKANKSQIVAVTLLETGWSASAPYTQTLEILGLAADSKGTVSLASTATLAQVEVAAAAKLLITAQAAVEITITAFGTKPSTDLPIQVLIVG